MTQLRQVVIPPAHARESLSLLAMVECHLCDPADELDLLNALLECEPCPRDLLGLAVGMIGALMLTNHRGDREAAKADIQDRFDRVKAALDAAG